MTLLRRSWRRYTPNYRIIARPLDLIRPATRPHAVCKVFWHRDWLAICTLSLLTRNGYIFIDGPAKFTGYLRSGICGTESNLQRDAGGERDSRLRINTSTQRVLSELSRIVEYSISRLRMFMQMRRPLRTDAGIKRKSTRTVKSFNRFRIA